MQYSRYLKGSIPTIETTLKIAKYFECSLDYLFGLSNDKEADIPIITIHGLRHTHSSLLLFAGVSIASVARRLGHASMTTTQKTYLHIINELENKDIDIIMRSLSSLG